MKNFPRQAREYLIAIGLIILVIAVFHQTGRHSFIGFDDHLYITENPHVRNGLTPEDVSWALTSRYAANWHPLTWISHMLDVELFGLDAGWHHRVNVFFHLVNSVLLFLVFRRMTGGIWQSAFVAALFAVHPLHVESVAWVAERKDLLSTLFWILTMWAYLWYTQRPGGWRYLLMTICFAAGLMCKPMLVTLPFALILLDWWPLRRFVPGSSSFGEASRLIAEKFPLMALSAASSAVTYTAQHSGGTVTPQEYVSMGARICNAAVSYAMYLWKTVWPASLAVFYPHPSVIGATIPTLHVAVALLLLGAISFLALREGKRHPYLAVGWLWYLGTLLPVIGLVQIGGQAQADRYTYVPLIGIFAAVAWGMPDALRRWRPHKRALGAFAAASLAALSTAAWIQTGYWRDNITLFTRAIRVTEKNWLAFYNLGAAHIEMGQPRQSIPYFQEALRIRPYDFQAWSKLGEAHLFLGEPQKAVPFLREAVGIQPDHAKTWADLGLAFLELGRRQEAIVNFREALRLQPDQPSTWNNLGSAYLELGQTGQAIRCLREALRIKPDYAKALYNLSAAYHEKGQRKEMNETFRLLRQVDPAKADAFLAEHGPVP